MLVPVVLREFASDANTFLLEGFIRILCSVFNFPPSYDITCLNARHAILVLAKICEFQDVFAVINTFIRLCSYILIGEYQFFTQ